MNQNQLLNDIISYVKNFPRLTLGEQCAWAAILLGLILVTVSLLMI